jgi:hypothetical protein
LAGEASKSRQCSSRIKLYRRSRRRSGILSSGAQKLFELGLDGSSGQMLLDAHALLAAELGADLVDRSAAWSELKSALNGSDRSQGTPLPLEPRQRAWMK